MVHAYREILVQLEMKVRGVHFVIVSDGAELLSPHDIGSLIDHDPVEMSIQGIGEMQLPVLDPCMPDDDDVSPVGVYVACQHDQPVPDRMNWAAESFRTSAVGHPILAQVSSSTETP